MILSACIARACDRGNIRMSQEASGLKTPRSIAARLSAIFVAGNGIGKVRTKPVLIGGNAVCTLGHRCDL
jgi:hypothetical protein